MEIDIRGSGPNCTITLGAENDAERHQIAALKRKAKDPRELRRSKSARVAAAVS